MALLLRGRQGDEAGSPTLSLNAHDGMKPQYSCVRRPIRRAREVIDLEIEVALERGEELPAPDADVPVRVERVIVTPPAA